MKRRFRLAPAVLSMVLLAAHFLRMQNIALMALSLAVVPLVFVKRQWVLRIVQIFLCLGSIEWVRMTVLLVFERKTLGQPYFRMVLILGAVCFFTLSSALFLKPGSFSSGDSN